VTGLSGKVKTVYSADKAVLQFGHLRQENQDLLSFNSDSTSNSVGTEVSGTLGFILLHFLDVKIDYRDDLVDFAYEDPLGKGQQEEIAVFFGSECRETLPSLTNASFFHYP